jgi:hypothetical protein
MPTIEEMRSALKANPSIDEMRAALKNESITQPQQPKEYDYSNVGQVASDLGKSFLNAAPMAGQAIGEVFGGNAGAGVGQMAGESVKQAIEGAGQAIMHPQEFVKSLTQLPTKEDVINQVNHYMNQLSQGATMAKAGELISKGLQAASPSVKEATDAASKSVKSVANSLSARAIGAERGTIKKLGQDKIEAAGEYALKNNLFGKFSGTDEMIANNEATKKAAGEMQKSVYSAIDEKGASTFNPLDTAVKIEEKIGGFYRSPINKGETAQLENTLESVLMRGDKNIPLSEAQALKEELGKVANWKNSQNITDKEQMARDAYGVVSKAIEDAASKGAESIGSQGLKETLKNANKTYSAAKTAEELLTNKSARELGNKLIGLTDWSVLGGGGAASLATGGAAIPATIGIYAVKKYGEKFGLKQAALGTNAIAENLANMPEFANAPKEILSVLANKVYESYKPQFQKNTENATSKWAQNGAKNLQDAGLDQETINGLSKDQLEEASNYKKGSKSMDKFIEKVQPKKPDQSNNYPMNVRKNGLVATVFSDKDLKEAISEGWSHGMA